MTIIVWTATVILYWIECCLCLFPALFASEINNIQHTPACNLKVKYYWCGSIIYYQFNIDSRWQYNDLMSKKSRIHHRSELEADYKLYAMISITTTQEHTVWRIFLNGGGLVTHMLLFRILDLMNLIPNYFLEWLLITKTLISHTEQSMCMIHFCHYCSFFCSSCLSPKGIFGFSVCYQK